MTDRGGPIAGRLRRPGWRDPRLLIGILLVAASLVAVAMVVRDADRTEPMYAARDTLTPGTVIGAEHLVAVNVRVPGQAYVPADADPTGLVVTRTVAAGELLPQSALARPDEFDGRPVAVRSELPLSEGVAPGALVDVFLTVGGPAGPVTRPIAEGLAVEAVVRGEQQFGVSRGDTVYVVVPSGDIADFLAALATDGSISVVGLGGAAS